MKGVRNLTFMSGIIFIGIFTYQFLQSEKLQNDSMQEAEAHIAEYKESSSNPDTFKVKENEAFATLEIPKLDKEIPVVEGTDADSLSKGIGHLSQSVLPGQGEQIVFSGHRDTVFREFSKMKIGDTFIVHMPYGSYSYVIKHTEIVDEDDTSVIRKMGEEVLVVTTCYPFRFVGNAPERFVAYAYLVEDEK
ncbi:class D sortase [Bacillus sp. REN10]|uniref:class D sortase n=1 Tax=Bacillus sp. REN10 TaxID=2782541 RepID=UPI001EED7AF3|nr:class D sortase [Bacillus sp. REN10]